ncbi:MAG: glycosyltransferase family 4 protein [Candidatus Nanopelagicales bacterium]|nr:glycosyltransferase family 4 protein [Candidatus Nanopelagicales bacterium]MDZ4248980.1 glycosyltransferase family 4 protein [Candidatus Nanopelagicales bacterium]
MGQNTARLLLIEPALPQYRLALFEDIHKRLAEQNIDFRVCHGELGPSAIARDQNRTSDWATEVRTQRLTLGGRAVTRKLIRPSMRRLRPDMIIVNQCVSEVETCGLLCAMPFDGPRVAMFGHGRSYSTTQGRAAAWFKQWLTRRTDWFFAYTEGGARHVVQHGFPASRVTVVNNTIDVESLQRDLAAVTPEALADFREAHGLLPGLTGLFLGGVDDAKGFDFLMETARELSGIRPGFRLLVGGDGVRRPDAEKLEASGWPLRVLGRLEGDRKALALAAADVMLIPSWIGLVAVDSITAGVPIVTRTGASHSPEAEYLDEGNSVWLPGSVTPRQFADACAQLLGDQQRLDALRLGCESAAPQHSLARASGAFAEGVARWNATRIRNRLIR